MALRKLKKNRRNSDVRHVSNAAEVCELRSLLSAVAICSDVVDTTGAVDSSEVVEVLSVDDVESPEVMDAVSEEFEFVPELAICTMVFMGDEVLPEESSEEEFVDESDASLVKYAFFSTFDTTGEVEEKVAVDGVEVVDGSEEWDPTWSYRTLISDVEDGDLVFTTFVGDIDFEGEDSELVDEFVDVTTLEDWDPSWAYRTVIVDGEGAVDEEYLYDETSDFEITLDSEPSGEIIDEFVDVTTIEDWDPSWAYRGVVVDGEGSVEEEYLYDKTSDFEITLDSEPGGEIIDEEAVVDGEEKPVVVEEFVEITDEEYLADGEEIVFEKEGNATPIRFNIQPFFRGSVGGVELQNMAFSNTANAGSGAESTFVGPVSAGNGSSSDGNVAVVTAPVAVPVVSVALAPPSLSIPVSQSKILNLFENEQDLSSVGTLVASLADAVPTAIESAETTLASGLDLELGGLTSSLKTDSGTDLNSLEPLLEGDTEIETVTPEEEQNTVPAEATDEAVASVDSDPPTVAEVLTNQATSSVVAVGRNSYERSERMVDRIMSEFAMNGFVG